MVKCEECGKEFNMLNNKHIKTHGMTTTEYRAKYPGALFYSPEMRQTLSETRGKAQEPGFCANNLIPPHKNKLAENIHCSPKCSMFMRQHRIRLFRLFGVGENPNLKEE